MKFFMSFGPGNSGKINYTLSPVESRDPAVSRLIEDFFQGIQNLDIDKQYNFINWFKNSNGYGVFQFLHVAYENLRNADGDKRIVTQEFQSQLNIFISAIEQFFDYEEIGHVVGHLGKMFPECPRVSLESIRKNRAFGRVL